MTQSGKTGLIAYLKVSRNGGFKYLVCCSSPMVEAMCTKFSHVLRQFLTFQCIHCVSSQQLSFLPFKIVFKPRLTVSGELQIGWEGGGGGLEGGQDGVQILKRKAKG